jgi:hypothetical protein
MEKPTKTPQTSGGTLDMPFSLPPPTPIKPTKPLSIPINLHNPSSYNPPNPYTKPGRTFLQVTTRTTKEVQHTTPYALQIPKSMMKITQQVEEILNHLKTKIPTSFPRPQWLRPDTTHPSSQFSQHPQFPNFTISFNKTPLSQMTFNRALTIIKDIIGEEATGKHIYFIKMKGKHLEIYLKNPPINNAPTLLPTNSHLSNNTITTSPNSTTTSNLEIPFLNHKQEVEVLITKLQENASLFLKYEPPSGATRVRVNRLEAAHYHAITIKGIPITWDAETTTRVLFETIKLPQGICEAPYTETPQPKGRTRFVHLLYDKPQIFFLALASSKTFNFKIENTTLSWDYMKPPKGYRRWCTFCHGPHNINDCPLKEKEKSLSTINLDESIPNETFIKENQIREKRRFEWIQVFQPNLQQINTKTPITSQTSTNLQILKDDSLLIVSTPSLSNKLNEVDKQLEIKNHVELVLTPPLNPQNIITPTDTNQSSILKQNSPQAIGKDYGKQNTQKNLKETLPITNLLDKIWNDLSPEPKTRQSQSAKRSRPGTITKFMSTSQEANNKHKTKSIQTELKGNSIINHPKPSRAKTHTRETIKHHYSTTNIPPNQKKQ